MSHGFSIRLILSIISPLFDLEDMSAFADDNYTVKWCTDLEILKINLETSLNNISTRLKDSGLKFNETKTEICLFSKSELPQMQITLNGENIFSY